MTQEMNKKAVADLFCMEDARAVCEAIGGLGLNTDNQATDDPLEYTPDNILDVTVNDNPDGMPAFPQLGQTEMDSETQAFVVDELSKELQADGRESLTDEDLIPFMVKIKGENRISQDLTAFIDQITNNTDTRLASQNVSEAQPNGVAVDLTNGGNGEPAAPAAPTPADPGALPGMGELPPEAPGGLAEPTEAPALATNADDQFSLDVPGVEPAAPAPEGEFNLDVPEPGPEVAPASGDDSFNLDIGDEGDAAPAGDNTDTIGELDFGDETPAEGGDKAPAEGGSPEDDLFSALDGMSDESLDSGDEKPADDKKAEGEKSDDNKAEDEKPAETECAAAPVTECGEQPVVEGNEGNVEPVVEPAAEPAADATFESVDAQLESIKANYVESLARERVRAVTESYERKKAAAEKRALCESIIANYQEGEAAKERTAIVESTMGEKLSELGDKMVGLCESAMQHEADAAQQESDARADALGAKLESILAGLKADKELDAKLESIVASVKAGKAMDDKLAAIVESVKNPASAQAFAEPKSGLDAKLESIIASTKAQIAAAK